MRSIPLLLSLISLINRIKPEESKDSKSDTNEVKYAGPIVYSNEKPPIIVFPTPPNSSISDTKLGQQNISLNDKNIEYVPFPYQELPVLIYKSNDSPPIHMVSQSSSTDGSHNLNYSLSNIEKRLGETSTGSQRGSRALKWSNFKLFNDKPVVMKTHKWGSTHMIDANNSSQMSSVNNPLSMSSAPHVVYSGHPPIHVFPQPIIIKEPELSELTSASEPYHVLKAPNSGNPFDISMSASNKHEVSTNPGSTQFYSYSSTPLGSPNSKSYGFRVKTRGNKQDTDFSSSTNYDNYDDPYSPQHSDGSSDSSSEDNSKFKPSPHYSNSLNSDSDRDYEKEYDPPILSYSREKSRDKYPKYSSNQWLDWDSDNSWLSSLLGYNRYPSRPRRPMTLSIVNSPSNEHLLFASTHGNPLEMENMALMNSAFGANPQFRHNGWVTGINPLRPTASGMRPVYSFSNLFNYRRPPLPPPPPPPTPYYTRFGPGMAPAPNNVAPVSMKQLGIMPPIMGLPSVSYPVRIPVSPFMMYGLRRPTLGPNGDLAFAESARNTTNGQSNKWVNIPEDIQMSGSHFQPTYVMPSAKPTSATIHKKPPIIIYQGLRPPVHVYKQPNITVGHNSDITLNSLVSALQQSQENQDSVRDQSTDDSTTTQSPYYQFFTTEESDQSFGNNYKSGSTLYIGENSGFSPRHSSGDWIPVNQNINSSKDSEQKE